jgi:dCMP deaminase
MVDFFMEKRPTYDEYFMSMAFLAATRSTCIRRKVGAVLVKNKHVLATGYNGPPKGMKHCNETGCLRQKRHIPSGERHEICRGLHAEQNAIIQAAVFGISIDESVIYITNTPCVVCAKMLINAGVKEIIYDGEYPDRLAKQMIEESHIKLRQFEGRILKPENNTKLNDKIEKIRKI